MEETAGWAGVAEVIRDLGPVGWYMLGAGSVLAAIKRGWLIFGEKAELAKEVARLEVKLEHATAELLERTGERDDARRILDALRNSPAKE